MKSGETFCQFGLAQNYFKKKEGEQSESITEWFRICAFKNVADRCIDILERGDQIIVEGRLRSSSYEKEGTTIQSLSVVAEKVHRFARHGGRKGGYKKTKDPSTNDSGEGSFSPYYGDDVGSPHSDDIPF